MPVILEPAAYGVWLDPAIQRPEKVMPLLRPNAADQMTAYPVGF